MKKEHTASDDEGSDMREEYDFTADDVRKAVRGKYADWYAQGTNVIVLDPDVAEVFPSPEAVNRALRTLASIIKEREESSAA